MKNVFKSMIDRVHSLTRSEVCTVIESTIESLGVEKIVHIPKPKNRLTICGDIHGQYNDLMTIFSNNGCPNSISNPYLFNGMSLVIVDSRP